MSTNEWYQCWALIYGGLVLVGDEENPLGEAEGIRDVLRAHGITAEVYPVGQRPSQGDLESQDAPVSRTDVEDER